MKQVLKWLSARNLRIALLAVPMLAAALYLWVFAADRYVADSVIALRDSERGAALEGLASLFVTATGSNRQDLMQLRSYLGSGDMLRQVDARLKLRESYSAPKLDWIFRLSPSASWEAFLAYFRNRVDVVYDDQSNLLRVRTEAFTPEVALQLNRELIQLGERFINENSHRLAREQMRFAEGELQTVRDRVVKAQTALFAFQNKHGMLDPAAQAQANTGLTAELQGLLARQQADLKGLLGYLNENSYQVTALRTQIAATQAQLDAENTRGLSVKGGAQLNVLAGEYQTLLGELQFAQDGYKLALSALESARIESTRKLKSLVLMQSPVQPQSPEQPRRLYILSALLLGLALFYGIARLVVATIEDHQQ